MPSSVSLECTEKPAVPLAPPPTPSPSQTPTPADTPLSRPITPADTSFETITSLAVARAHNAHAPINRLPLELLRAIFAHLAPPPPPLHPPHPACLHAPLVPLRRVCTAWAALSTAPRLPLALDLHCAHNHPPRAPPGLPVAVTYAAWPPNSSAARREGPALAALRTLTPRLAELHVLSRACVGAPVWAALADPAPVLARLTIAVPAPQALPPLFARTTPRLTHLALCRAAPWPGAALPSLTHLALHRLALAHTQLLALLAGSPLLTDLVLVDALAEPSALDAEDAPAVALPALCRLEIGACAAAPTARLLAALAHAPAVALTIWGPHAAPGALPAATLAAARCVRVTPAADARVLAWDPATATLDFHGAFPPEAVAACVAGAHTLYLEADTGPDAEGTANADTHADARSPGASWSPVLAAAQALRTLVVGGRGAAQALALSPGDAPAPPCAELETLDVRGAGADVAACLAAAAARGLHARRVVLDAPEAAAAARRLVAEVVVAGARAALVDVVRREVGWPSEAAAWDV